MEIVQLVAILGGLISGIGAFLAVKLTGKRLDIENELKIELSSYLNRHYELMRLLENAQKKGSIKVEINNHLEMYERILNEIVISMPDEKRNEVYPAINQTSEKGKVAYIEKLISRSLSEA